MTQYFILYLLNCILLLFISTETSCATRSILVQYRSSVLALINVSICLKLHEGEGAARTRTERPRALPGNPAGTFEPYFPPQFQSITQLEESTLENRRQGYRQAFPWRTPPMHRVAVQPAKGNGGSRGDIVAPLPKAASLRSSKQTCQMNRTRPPARIGRTLPPLRGVDRTLPPG